MKTEVTIRLYYSPGYADYYRRKPGGLEEGVFTEREAHLAWEFPTTRILWLVISSKPMRHAYRCRAIPDREVGDVHLHLQDETGKIDFYLYRFGWYRSLGNPEEVWVKLQYSG